MTSTDATAVRGPREPARILAVLIVVILLGWTAWAAARPFLPFGEIETYGGFTYGPPDREDLVSATGEPLPPALTPLGATVAALPPVWVLGPAYAVLLVLLALAPGWKLVEKTVLAALPVAGVALTLVLTTFSLWVAPALTVVLLGAGVHWAVRRVAGRA